MVMCGNMPIYAIIVAAGSGTRFGTALPKQFELLGGRPVVMHAIERIRRLRHCTDVTLVLNPSHTELWAELCQRYKFDSPRIACGGSSRTGSVRNALATLPPAASSSDSIILIHDGARPLIDTAMVESEIISRIYQPGIECVIPCRPVTDTLMTNDADNARPVDRNRFAAVQTPQAFRGETLIKAYASMPDDAVMTDDASVVARYAGAKIHLAEGSPCTIKITYPCDIAMAEAFLADESAS